MVLYLLPVASINNNPKPTKKNPNTILNKHPNNRDNKKNQFSS
jgi:hypothetical protein